MVGDDEPASSGSTFPARIESSYVINLHDLDMKHVKDFTFVHGKRTFCILHLSKKEVYEIYNEFNGGIKSKCVRKSYGITLFKGNCLHVQFVPGVIANGAKSLYHLLVFTLTFMKENMTFCATVELNLYVF